MDNGTILDIESKVSDGVVRSADSSRASCVGARSVRPGFPIKAVRNIMAFKLYIDLFNPTLDGFVE